MRDQDTVTLDDKVVITQLNRQSAIDLMSHAFFRSAIRRGDVLKHGLGYKSLQAVKLIPRATRLVAYNNEEKKAIGFLYLEENTNWLQTIEYVFVDPRYRRLGLATRLLYYALFLAKEKGARKVNLNVYANHTKVIDLYRKMGFKKIGHTLLTQVYLPGFAPFRVGKRIIMGQGRLTKLALGKKGRLFEVQTSVRRDRERLLKIFRDCVDKEWIDFFEINADNLINGSRHVWQPPFYRDALINGTANGFALLFNRPFSSKATVELYGTSNSVILRMLKELLRILANRGISFTEIRMPNPSNNLPYGWFEEKGMKTFQFVNMGKTL